MSVESFMDNPIILGATIAAVFDSIMIMIAFRVMRKREDSVKNIIIRLFLMVFGGVLGIGMFLYYTL